MDDTIASPKFLIVESFGAKGHKKINTFFLEILCTIGKVTFMAPNGYLENCHVNDRVYIQDKFVKQRSKIGVYWAQMLLLKCVIDKIESEHFDAVFFLSYETISFSLCWPRDLKVFLFEHNNIENSYKNHIKSFFYRHLPRDTTHLVFQDHIAEWIREVCNRKAIVIPHPHYRGNIYPINERRKSRKIIFSPSSSTPVAVQDNLRAFIAENKDLYFGICKGPEEKREKVYDCRPFFDDYETLLENCDLVFIGSSFTYRVNGVAYEALSYGKPIAIFDSLFARKLKKKFPHLVFPIKRIEEIKKIEINFIKAQEEQKIFLEKHSFSAIKGKIVSLFNDI